MKNFLTKTQVEQLKNKQWDVEPSGKYLELYPEDFDNDTIWLDLCDSVGVSYDAPSITILYFAKK
jgi:hypothetical protein